MASVSSGSDVAVRPVTRLLVANRGEIARRVQRTARAMGMATVAVYADGDADAPFVREADDAVALGGRTAAETYLDVEKVLLAAKRTGADAIHPGYGFLSESADLAEAVEGAGMVWVGPPPAAIAAMGDKLAAKRLLAGAGVPTLGSVELPVDADLGAALAEVGLPALVKASAGGGGKGMRVVRDAASLADDVAAARREAVAAFGDGTLFLERYVTGARHVEVQILGDAHGNLVHLFERECSIQRRHQKIVEEAPSPAVDAALRARMGEAALSAARAIGYRSAGTVEMLLTPEEEFFFLEVNTRLQVEHPVTEAVTGVDLVREQLLVAQGMPLSVTQDSLTIAGHAVEARLYAEDPANDFLPATGTVVRWTPASDPPARYDAGIESGSEVGVEFDPLLAKVVAHAPTREEAALRLALALERTVVDGVVTNRDFLVATLRHPAFLAGDTTTDFIERHDPPRRRVASPDELADAAVAVALTAAARRSAGSSFPSGWRNSVMPMELAEFRALDDVEVAVRYRVRRDGSFDVAVGERAGVARVRSVEDERVDLELDGRRIRAVVRDAEGAWWAHGPFGEVHLRELPRFPLPVVETVEGGQLAPMPGLVISVHVAVGDRVEEGQLLAVLEAMKMEHRIVAPAAGVVSEVLAVAGAQVAKDDLLVVIDEHPRLEQG